MSLFVNNVATITGKLVLIILLVLGGTCLAQDPKSDSVTTSDNTSSVYIKPDATIVLPLIKITDKRLQDSIQAAITQLEHNWNYNDAYGYFFIIHFITNTNQDSLVIDMSIRSIRNLFPIIAYRPTKYISTIGCTRVHGYNILVYAWSWLSHDDINPYYECVNDSVRFELNTCGSIEPFCPWPFNKMKIITPLKNVEKKSTPKE